MAGEEVVVVSGDDDTATEEVAEVASDAVDAIEEVAEVVADAVVDAVEAVAEVTENGDTDHEYELNERLTRVEEQLSTHVMDYQAHSHGVSTEEVVAIAENVVDNAVDEIEPEPELDEVTIVTPDVAPEEKRSLLKRFW